MEDVGSPARESFGFIVVFFIVVAKEKRIFPFLRSAVDARYFSLSHTQTPNHHLVKFSVVFKEPALCSGSDTAHGAEKQM